MRENIEQNFLNYKGESFYSKTVDNTSGIFRKIYYCLIILLISCGVLGL